MGRSFNERFVNGDTATGIATAGTTQATATTCPADHIVVQTSTAGQGVMIKQGPAGTLRSVFNATGNGILVYPWVGAAFAGAAINAPINLPANFGAWFMCFTPTLVGAIV